MAVDLIAGDPAWLYRLVPHPVVLIGRAVDALTRLLNRQSLPRGRRILLGGLCTLIVVGGAGALGALLHSLLAGAPFGWIMEGILGRTLLAFRGLYDAVPAVPRGLRESLEAGSAAVSRIVGLDPASLEIGSA